MSKNQTKGLIYSFHQIRLLKFVILSGKYLNWILGVRLLLNFDCILYDTI